MIYMITFFSQLFAFASVVFATDKLSLQEASPWPTCAGNPQRTGWTNTTFPIQVPEIAWNFTLSEDIPGCEKKTNTNFDVVPHGAVTRGDGTILVLQVRRAYHAEMTLLAVRSGKLVFNTTGMPFASVGDAASGAVLSDDSVIVSARGSVVRVSKDGSVLWKALSEGRKTANCVSEPMIAGNVAIVTGLLCTLYEGDSNIDGGAQERPPAYAGLSLATGKTLWTAKLDPLYGFCATPTLSSDGKSLWVVATGSGDQPYSARYGLHPATGRFLSENVSFPTIGNPAFVGERKNIGVGNFMWLVYDEGKPACWPFCNVMPRLFRINSLPPYKTAGVTVLPANMSENNFLKIAVAVDRTSAVLFSINIVGDLFAIDAISGITKWISRACHCSSNCAEAPYLWGDNGPYLKQIPPVVDKAGNVLITIGTKMCLVAPFNGATLWVVDLKTQWHVAAPTFGADGTIYAVTVNDKHGTRLLALKKKK